MDFGHGSTSEYTWIYTANEHKQNQQEMARNLPSLVERFKQLEIRVLKIGDKWDRAMILDSKSIFHLKALKLFLISSKLTYIESLL